MKTSIELSMLNFAATVQGNSNVNSPIIETILT